MVKYNTVTFKSDNKINNLSIGEYARWIALIEAVNLIKDKNPKFEDYKMNALRAYINDRYQDIITEIVFKYENKDPDIIKEIELS